MSDHIAHIAICDDAFRLASLHPKTHPLLLETFRDYKEDAHLGSVTRFADQWSVKLIVHAREQQKLDASERDPNWQRKLAFVLGSLTHRAADRLTKPITKIWKGGDETGGDANESKIIQDVMIWKEVFCSGQGEHAYPFSPQALDLPPTPDADATERVFRLLLRRALIAMHTLRPDPDHIHDWLDGLFVGLQTFPKSLDQYAQLAREWDRQKVQKYLVEKRFYHRDDPLIRLARGIQRGEAVSHEGVAKAYENADASTTRYDRALQKAMDYLFSAGELLEAKIDEAAAEKRFEYGVPDMTLMD